MKAIRSKGSKIEILLGKALWKKGLRYRKNYKKVLGIPDFVFLKYRVAVFADSEFWHGKNWEEKKHDHKSNRKFWHQKIERNIQRDREVNTQLKKNGWTILRFWGKEIEKDSQSCADQVEQTLLFVKNNEFGRTRTASMEAIIKTF